MFWPSASRNFDPIEVYNRWYSPDHPNGPDHLWAPEYLLVATWMALFLLACMLIA